MKEWQNAWKGDRKRIAIVTSTIMSETTPRNPQLPRFPVIVDHPTYDDARSNFNGSDYLKWFGLTAASFPAGYVFGVKVNKHIARPSMWVTGMLGSLGGFLWAYQSSSFRLQGRLANDGEVKKYIPKQE